MTTTVLVTLWNPLASGAPVMAAQFTEGLRDAGHHVVVAHGPRPAGSTAPDVLDRLRSAGATLVALPAFTARNEMARARRCRDICRREGVEVVLSFQQRDRALGALVARLARVPLVVHCGLPPRMQGGPIARRAKAMVQRWALRSAARVVCPSPVVHDAVVGVFGVDAVRAPVLYNGVDTARVLAAAEEARLADAGPHDHVRLVSVGRTEWEKGHDVALSALAALPADVTPWHYTILGARTGGADDEHDRRLGELLDSPGLEARVSMPGWSNDVAAELGRCDLYLHPSRAEGWSLAVCEALAAGCPTVLSDCAGRPPGFVDGTHGWIVPHGDVDALRLALATVLALTPEERASVGRAGAAHAAEHFDIVRCRTQMVTWIEDIAAGQDRPDAPAA
jgi:glycosyltransferase involved in cell wall biosynthesis